MNGMQLNNWSIGKKIGEGACGSVYEVESTIPLEHKYDRTKQFVMKVTLMPAKPKGKPSKRYQDAKRHADTLYSEYLIYQKLYGIDGIPSVPLRAYGETQGYRYLVIERLDANLEDVLRSQGSITNKAASQYGLQIIKILKALHDKNVLYVDMKPENLMIKESKVYCVDFGISSPYISSRGAHIAQSQTPCIIGTPHFVSVNCHHGIVNSRRDDIESMLYVLIYLMKGSLPWDQAKTDIEAKTIKKNIEIGVLCDSLSTEWGDMIRTIRNHAFEKCPDYEYFENQFIAMM